MTAMYYNHNNIHENLQIHLHLHYGNTIKNKMLETGKEDINKHKRKCTNKSSAMVTAHLLHLIKVEVKIHALQIQVANVCQQMQSTEEMNRRQILFFFMK